MMSNDWQYRHPFWRSGVVSYFPFSPWPGGVHEQSDGVVPGREGVHGLEVLGIIRYCTCGSLMAPHPLVHGSEWHCPVCGRWEGEDE